MESEHKDAILARFYDTVSAVVQGTLVTAAVQGLLAGIGIAIVGVPFAILLGVATSFVSLLPFGGPVIWISVVVYLLFNEAYGRAVILLVWGVVVVSSADNVIRPLIIGGRTRIPTVFLFFGILGGLQAYGFLGIFLGPALIAILVAFIRIYREEYAAVPYPPPL
jgi:predicted PurR-regulated permease PerM